MVSRAFGVASIKHRLFIGEVIDNDECTHLAFFTAAGSNTHGRHNNTYPKGEMRHESGR